MIQIIKIEKRKELNEYFEKYGNEGYSAAYTHEGNIKIKFTANPTITLIVPLVELVLYAGYLPRRKV
jgi:hypothetical protein